MSNPFLGELRPFSFSFAPRGWAQCNGQLLPINQNQAIFSLLGTMYGGNGIQNFALPNLQGRTPIHVGNGHVQGETGGEQAHTLIASELPAHTHRAQASANTADRTTGTGNAWAAAPQKPYSPTLGSPVVLAPNSLTPAGGSQPHLNLQPFLTLNYCIALQGIFPSRS